MFLESVVRSRYSVTSRAVGQFPTQAGWQRQSANQPEAYQQFSATELFCPKCRQAMPVRERMLLVLPDGDLFDYSCSKCGTSVGSRKA